jgi:dihydrofolate reductase
LKDDPSIGRIGLSGSVSVVRQLLDAGLIDQLHLFVHPATAGSGLRLVDEGAPDRHVNLVSATPFATGVIHLTYEPDPNPPTRGYEEAAERLPQD